MRKCKANFFFQFTAHIHPHEIFMTQCFTSTHNFVFYWKNFSFYSRPFSIYTNSRRRRVRSEKYSRLRQDARCGQQVLWTNRYSKVTQGVVGHSSGPFNYFRTVEKQGKSSSSSFSRDELFNKWTHRVCPVYLILWQSQGVGGGCRGISLWRHSGGTTPEKLFGF